MVKLIAFLKRKQGMSLAEFRDYWVNEHTKISARLPGLKGYYINIATERQPDGEDAYFDGTAELWWDSIDEMEAAFASDIGIAAGVDAEHFASFRVHLYTDEHTIVPGPHNRDGD